MFTTDSATYSFGVAVTLNPCFSIADFVAGPIAAIFRCSSADFSTLRFAIRSNIASTPLTLVRISQS